jgi:hypothetical protein
VTLQMQCGCVRRQGWQIAAPAPAASYTSRLAVSTLLHSRQTRSAACVGHFTSICKRQIIILAACYMQLQSFSR